MRHFKFLSAVLILFTAFNLTSCSDVEPIDPAIQVPIPEGPEGPEGPEQTGNFHADFDSQTYVATTIQATLSNSQLIILSAKGTPPNLETISIGMNLTDAVIGTYPANENLIGYQKVVGSTVVQYTSINPDNMDENTGTITITAIDMVNHTITGTFSFTGYAEDDAGNVTTKQFTNGVFDHIVFSGATTPTPGTDSFFAKVNGVDFNEDQIDVAIVTQDDPDTPENEGLPIHPAISIVGVKTNGDNVGLSIHETLTPGTYQMTGFMNEDDMVNGSVKVGTTFLLSNSGSVTIISNDGVRIKGTFQFSATNFDNDPVWQISAGTFDVEIP